MKSANETLKGVGARYCLRTATIDEKPPQLRDFIFGGPRSISYERQNALFQGPGLLCQSPVTFFKISIVARAICLSIFPSDTSA